MKTTPREEAASRTDTMYHAWSLSPTETEAALRTSCQTGLTADEGRRRLLEYGFNQLIGKKKPGLFGIFLGQFRSFMILILFVAAAVSGITGYLEGEGFTDAVIILAIVFVNACIGTAQESKAEKTLEALEKIAAPHCKVMRDGLVSVIEAGVLVPGDVVVVESGDMIPADMRLVEAVNLKIQESSLTGESVPEEKHTDVLPAEALLGDRENMAFASGIVTYGRGRGIVTATGMQTEMGRIAGLLQTVPETRSPMQIRLDQLGRYLGLATLGICLIIFAAGTFQGREVLGMFMIAVSLAVAAIPEGLPAVSTVVQAMGMQRLAEKNAIVRNLSSVETLGSTTVICSDKTGTLTRNRMSVVSLFADNAEIERPESLTGSLTELLTTAVLASDASLSETGAGVMTTGDPTETALLDLGLCHGLNKNALEKDHQRLAEIPFDSERKMMSTINRDPSGTLVLRLKGGPDEVLARCTHILHDGEIRPLDGMERQRIREQNRTMAARALRVLAAAFKSLVALPETMNSACVEQGLVFCGLIGMVDPPREEVSAAVATCRTAGIRPVMITGDHMATAVAVADQLGIRQAGDRTMAGIELERIPDAELSAIVTEIAVFARVAPEHKVRIVRAFQNRGAVVAMTGDGVNDAPALKLADIGVAMGVTGTDVSREASDIVLTDDNFATIVTAVGEGRRIYDNVLKAVQFLLSTNIGEMLVIFAAIMAGWATPLLPVQILCINLITDSLPALALSVDPAGQGIMERRPVPPGRSILQGTFLIRIILQGIMIAVLSLIAFRIGARTDTATAQTMTFAVLAFSQMSHVFNVRSDRHSAFIAMFSNKILLGALAITMGLMLLVIEVPFLRDIFSLVALNATQWIWVVCLSLVPLPLVEGVKLLARCNRG